MWCSMCYLTSTGDRPGDGGAHSKASCRGRKEQKKNQGPCRQQATAWTKNDPGRWPLMKPWIEFAVNARLWVHMNMWGHGMGILYGKLLSVRNCKQDRLHPRKRNDFSPLYRSGTIYWNYSKCKFSSPEGTEQSHRTPPLLLPLPRDLDIPLLASWHWPTPLSCPHKYRCPIYILCFHWVSWRCATHM